MLILGEAISQIWIDGLKNIVADSDEQVKRILIFAKTMKLPGT